MFYRVNKSAMVSVLNIRSNPVNIVIYLVWLNFFPGHSQSIPANFFQVTGIRFLPRSARIFEDDVITWRLWKISEDVLKISEYVSKHFAVPVARHVLPISTPFFWKSENWETCNFYRSFFSFVDWSSHFLNKAVIAQSYWSVGQGVRLVPQAWELAGISVQPLKFF